MKSAYRFSTIILVSVLVISLLSIKDPALSAADTIAPQVTFVYPALTKVSGKITLSVNASDNVGVTKVKFLDGSKLIETSDKLAPDRKKLAFLIHNGPYADDMLQVYSKNLVAGDYIIVVGDPPNYQAILDMKEIVLSRIPAGVNVTTGATFVSISTIESEASKIPKEIDWIIYDYESGSEYSPEFTTDMAKSISYFDRGLQAAHNNGFKFMVTPPYGQLKNANWDWGEVARHMDGITVQFQGFLQDINILKTEVQKVLSQISERSDDTLTFIQLSLLEHRGEVIDNVNAINALRDSDADGILIFHDEDQITDMKNLLTSFPNRYWVTWDTRTVSNGSHTLKASASDAAGNTGTVSLTVTVENKMDFILSLKPTSAIVTKGTSTSTTLTPTLSISTILFKDDFNDGIIDSAKWSSTSNASEKADCGAQSSPNSLYFTGIGKRYASTVPLDVSEGGKIRFYLKYGKESFPCEDANLGKDMKLEYSTDGGVRWSTINTYNATKYGIFTLIEEIIPDNARTSSTQFRWFQGIHSGSKYDNWAIDDVSIEYIPDAISFSCSGLPSGASCTFMPSFCTPACTSNVTISTTSSTPIGTFPITITGVGGGITRSSIFNLQVK